MNDQENFSKVRFKFIGRCKVCKLVYADQNLFIELHQLRYRDESSLADVANFLKEKFIERNYTTLLPNIVNLSNHFSKHIPTDFIVAYKIATKKNEVVKVPKGELPEGAKKALCQMVEERVAVYDDLENLYKKFKAKVEDYEAEFNHKIDIANSTQYAVLIKELKSFLVELAKMNNNEQLVKVILQTAFQKYTMGALRGISKECDILKSTLRTYIKDVSEIDRILLGHQTRLYEELSASSKDAINLIKDQFKIT